MVRKPKEEKEQMYDVEVITAARVVAPDDEAQSPKKKKKKFKNVVGLWEYYVKWYGYNETYDSWQPAANLDCEALIQRFWEAVGIDDEDYQIGVELHAPDEWIDREAARFRREHEKEEKRKAREDERRKRERQAAKKMEKERRAQEMRESSQPTASTSKTKDSKKKRQRIESSDSEEDDDSDVPLAKRPRRKHEDPPKIPSAAAFRESRDEVKQTKRKRDEKYGAAFPPAKQVHADEGRHSPSSLFSEDEIDLQLQRPSPALVPPSPPAPMPIPLPFRAPPSAPTIIAKPPPLPNRKTSNLGSVKVGSAPNPLAKLPSQVPQEAGPSGSGISTKARLGLGALVPLQPRKMSSAGSLKPEPVKTGSSTIMATNFRKSGGIPAAQHHPEPTLASLNATPAPPLMEPTLASLADGTVVDSPVAFDPPADPFMDPPSSTMRNQVDEFLSSFMPAEMAGPLEPATESVVEPLPPPPLPSRVAPPPLPTRKIFKWEGSLIVSTGTPATRVLKQSFPVVMENQMDSHLQGLRFPFFFKPTGLDQLKATRIYHAQELASILPTRSTPTHFAKVSLQPSAVERKRWTSFLRFLGKSQQVVLLPLSLDDDIPAHLLLAPPEVYLRIRLKIPSHIAPHVEAADNLVACILPHTLTLKQRSEGWKPELETLRKLRVQIAKRSDPRFHHLLKSRPLLQEATRVLNFPTETYDYLKSTSRSWAILPPMDSSSKKSTYEVELLRSILVELKESAIRKQTSVDPQKSKIHMMREAVKPDSAGVLFIHVGALRYLRRLPFMRDRLLSNDYVRFYSFGSHSSVSQKFWGVREVFPCGGIVTFLPSAFLNYPLEIMENIRKISEHPFWSAYILPSVLGMVARMSGADGNDLTKWAYSYLLKAIEGGQLALIEAPPENKFCFGEPSNDHRTRWFNDYLTALPPSQEESLSFAMGALASVTANTPQSNWPMLIEKEVAQDLARMQTQPSNLTEYRRYVVLTGVPIARQDSLEWLSPDKFTFRDSFLPE